VKPEVYFSLDVETDGPIPGPHSMLSLGCVAFDRYGKEVGDFSVNLEELPGAQPDPGTASWWQTQPEAWAECRKDPKDPHAAMLAFVQWVQYVCGGSHKPVALAYPAGFDWTFVYWYMRRFLSCPSPFGFVCLDLKSYAMAKLGTQFRDTSKKTMPKEWFKGLPPHTHKAVDDAREQGLLFFRMLAHGGGR
jgi:hypothetical protein